MSTDTASEALLAWEISTRENIVQNLADNPELLALVRTMPFGRWSDRLAEADALIARRALDEIF